VVTTSREQQQLLAAREYMRENLPFYISSDWNSCYSHPFYQWQRDFLLVGTETIDRKLLAFLTAANQIGKSSIQIIKCINMALRTDLWPKWFPNRRPRTFLYLYPESKLATVEFEEKWVKEYLPRGEMKNDPRWGWKEEYSDKGTIESITFATGVTCYFRFYSQKPTVLQAHTADAVFLDEEVPQEHFDELLVRTQARQSIGSGHTSCVFTATLGQKFLYDCMERQGTPDETFKKAWKRQVSLFDCLFYADGTPSRIWTEEYIKTELIPKYRNEKEIQRRIYGRFVKSSGLLFEEFNREKNTEPAGVTNMEGWRSYVGLDFGSGGEYGHSSAIIHVKVCPAFENARVVDVWWSRKRRMTQGDLLLRYKMMMPRFGRHWAFGDWGATDLFTLAAREQIVLHKAEKSHEIGINLCNSLFKDEQLKVILGTSPDAQQLCTELQSTSEETPKRHRIDDCTDALRYAISLIPFRLKALKESESKAVHEKVLQAMNPRLAFYKGIDRKDDPMRSLGDEPGEDLAEAISYFEEML
jgi:hypothetical protein